MDFSEGNLRFAVGQRRRLNVRIGSGRPGILSGGLRRLRIGGAAGLRTIKGQRSQEVEEHTSDLSVCIIF